MGDDSQLQSRRSPEPAESSRDERPVGVRLGIDRAGAMALPPFAVPTSTPPSPPRARRSPYSRAGVVDARLAPFEPDARAGIDDARLAKRTGVTTKQVRRWRRRRRIVGRRGPSTIAAQIRLGTRLLLHGERVPFVHDVVAGGAFESPAYVLREPLNFDAFVSVVGVLVAAGMTPGRIAAGVGVVERDVLTAAEVLVRRLR